MGVVAAASDSNISASTRTGVPFNPRRSINIARNSEGGGKLSLGQRSSMPTTPIAGSLTVSAFLFGTDNIPQTAVNDDA